MENGQTRRAMWPWARVPLATGTNAHTVARTHDVTQTSAPNALPHFPTTTHS